MLKSKVTKPQKVHVKTGDTVQVIAGREKGKVGQVTRVITKTSQVIVEGVNIRTRHVKPQRDEESGQIITKEFPIHSSNVMLYSEKQKVASRYGFTVTEDGRKVRVLKKTGEIID